MKKRPISFLLLTLFAVLLIFAGCVGQSSSDSGEEEYVKVMLSFGDGLEVIGDNPLLVKKGESAEFDVVLGDSFIIESLSLGTYSDGKVIIDPVLRSTTVKVFTRDVGYDTSMKLMIKIYGDAEDRITGSDGKSVIGKILQSGTAVTASAGQQFKTFLGWSLGGYTYDRSEMISTDRTFDFRISPQYQLNPDYGVIELYANYINSNTLYYDANGGTVDRSSSNMTYKDYYRAVADGNKGVTLTMTDKFTSYDPCVSLFYDDGTFKREGYVLMEYNTKSDGTGEGYSLGSLYYMDPEEAPVLYCIWGKATDTSKFSYVDKTYSRPQGVVSDPDWKETGVYITGYNGSDRTVVIPETIDGKYVIGIEYGAFNRENMETLVLSRYIRYVADTAITGCSSLRTVYYSDAIYSISSKALDEASYSNLHNFYVNATTAPRYAKNEGGTFSIKLSRVLSALSEDKIIAIAGSSVYQGVSTSYFEALMPQYRFVNFGTTRTTNGMIYLEAMGKLTHSGDVVVYAPENSTYMMGEREVYWKTLRDIELMYNLFRYIDFSNYENVISAFADFNQSYRFKKDATHYEERVKLYESGSVNNMGDHFSAKKAGLNQNGWYGYYITMNERYKSKDEGNILDSSNLEANKDYTDPNNKTWATITDAYFKDALNEAILTAKSGGAKVLFGFCPADADSLVDAARNRSWLSAYENMLRSNYRFDDFVGSVTTYIYAHKYMYDSSFHLNDMGRAYHTYNLYRDLCTYLGISPKGFRSVGTSFAGCIFESGSSGRPLTGVDYLG